MKVSTDDGEYGPKMQMLTHRMRQFVIATFEIPGADPTNWARAAGYSDNGGSGIRVQAHTLWHDERIQAAIREEGQRRLGGLIPLANAIHVEVMMNPQSSGSERLKAVQMVYDRVGLHSTTEQKVTHTTMLDDPTRIARLEAIAKKYGIDRSKVLGRSLALKRPAVDAEFVETVNLEDMI